MNLKPLIQIHFKYILQALWPVTLKLGILEYFVLGGALFVDDLPHCIKNKKQRTGQVMMTSSTCKHH